jgi:acyl carrier protein
MNTQTFLEKLQDELEEDDALSLDTKFKELENYDSMSVLSLIAFIDESFDKSLDTKHFQDIATVQELKELIGTENFED